MPKLNVLREILSWSLDRPNWQRDCLRRLVLRGGLEKSDIQELASICKSRVGLDENRDAEPLATHHLPEPKAATAPVSLVSLTHDSGVNALAEGQVIAFGTALTVVYGANAAGKSGYTRILKRACRARGAEEILGNVVSGAKPTRPAATIRYKSSDSETDYKWDDDNPPHVDLSRVSVFDHHCASVYVTEQTDVAYRPLGLDLFDKLADACEGVRRVIESERRLLESTGTQLPDVPAGTRAHDLLSRLSSLTPPEAIRKLAALTEEEIASVDQLRGRLRDLSSDDPQKKAKLLELQAKRASELGGRFATVHERLGDRAIAEAFSARDEARRANDAVQAIRRETFDSQPVPNSGTDAWRALWQAAERFSTEDAYPDSPFPLTGPDSRCVLCQQPLKDDAVARFERFHKFLTSELQRGKDQAFAEFDTRRAHLQDLAINHDTYQEQIDELQFEDPDLADDARRFLKVAQDRRLEVMNALADGSPTPATLPELPLVSERIGKLADDLSRRVSELRGDDRSATIREIEAQLRELESRQTIGKHLDTILTEVERRKRLAAYLVCLDETKTTAITRKSTEVTKSAVTEQLASTFSDELKALKFRHVEVEMVAAGGTRGQLYHRLQLRRAPGVSVPDVVSEGEARCLSIAAFFAELSTAEDRSAVLFDDPVSSLDHRWRSSVAGRLAKEAQSRQVVVFTHDIVFLLALIEHAKACSVDVSHQHLRRFSSNAGFCEQRLPWAAMKVKDRIKKLRELHRDATKTFKEGNQSEYERRAGEIYGLLRESWERGLEEVLLSGVVERYRPSIQTLNKVQYLADIGKQDCDELEEGMTTCSKWMTGHDLAPAENEPYPEPDDVEGDIGKLDEWRTRINRRRSGN